MRSLVLLVVGCGRTAATLPSPADVADTAGGVDTGQRDTGGAGPDTPISPTTLDGTVPDSMLGWRLLIADRALWVSAPLAAGTGAAYRFPAAALDGTLTLDDSDLHLQGAVASGLLGYGIASVDVDLDGVLDLVAGAPTEEGSLGAVYLLDGGLLGAQGTDSATRIAGVDPGGSFGVQVGPGPTAGTFLVAATDDDQGGVAGGAVYLLGAAGQQGVVYADEDGQQLGTGLAVGDLDADGVGDVIVSGASEGIGNNGDGDVGVFDGPLDGSRSLADADLRMSGAAPMDHFGNRVASSADLNGDGYDDLVVAAYWRSAAAERGGGVYIFHGPLEAGTQPQDADATLVGEEAYGYLGISVDMVADALVVGEYGAGRAHVFAGPLAGTLSLADARTHSGTIEGAFGYSAVVGDLDGGDAADVAVGAYTEASSAGAVFIYPGEAR